VPARLGGAEIALLQPFDGHLARAEQSVRDLLAAVAGPVRVGGVEVEFDLSAGVAAGPMHATQGADLLRCAGEALRRAKATESEVEVYDPAQDIGRDFGPRLLPELIKAFEHNLIGAWYQPKVELAGGLAVELEAQLRWVHPEHGVLDAAVLRPLAARAGLTRRLTRVMLAEAVRRCAWWQAGGVRLGVAVDIGTADVLDSRLPYELARLVSEVGLPAGALQLELAEDLMLVDPGRTRRALGQFRTLGVRLALDHYGRSAPSLTRLRAMPVQELKLDRSFVASVLQGGPDEAVVRSTISLARSLGIRTVADGVDTTDLLDRVRSYGVRGVQGAAVVDPMSPDALADWLGTAPAPDPGGDPAHAAPQPQPIG
jgi:predicted signal transduction protein with EAL and GGDEF domain